MVSIIPFIYIIFVCLSVCTNKKDKVFEWRVLQRAHNVCLKRGAANKGVQQSHSTTFVETKAGMQTRQQKARQCLSPCATEREREERVALTCWNDGSRAHARSKTHTLQWDLFFNLCPDFNPRFSTHYFDWRLVFSDRKFQDF